MAKRRMMSLELMRSDEFLELPAESQLLYVHLSVEADDDGFLYGKKRILAMLGLGEPAFTALETAGFLIVFPSGAAVIAHWPLLNKIPKDRYTPTRFQEELGRLKTVPAVGYVLQQGFTEADCPALPEENTKNDPPDGAPQATERSTRPMELYVEEETLTLPLDDDETYRISRAVLDRWRLLYPDVDVRQEFRSMRGWLLTHPEKQRTAETVERFINHWLQTAQERPSAYRPYGYFGKEREAFVPSEAAIRAEEKMMMSVPKLKKRKR